MRFSSDKRIPISAAIPQLYINPLDQKRVEYFFKKMPHLIEEGYKNGCYRFCRIVLGIIRKAISTGNPPPGAGVSWAPLSAKSLELYQRWGHSKTHPWYVLGEMLRQVNIFVNNHQRFYVGMPRGVMATHPNPKHRGQKYTLATIASYLEAGGDHYPPRPLFNPAFKSAGGKERLTKFVVEDLRKLFRKYGYNPYKK